MFKSTQNKGFQITFDNGITISVQFGNGNYCSNKYHNGSTFVTECPNAEIAIWKYHNGSTFVTECPNAEIAIWDKDGELYEFEDGSREKGWCNVADVMEWMNRCQNAKDSSSI